MLPNARTAAPVEILLVEDNPGDAVLIGEAMKDNKLHNNLNLVRDGVEAMAFLKREGKYAQAIRPDLVILDLNLPRKSGREVLSEIKSDPLLKSIPVVVLTSSAAEEDVLRSYELNCNCYVTKPLELEQFMRIVNSIESFWLSIVCLPP